MSEISIKSYEIQRTWDDVPVITPDNVQYIHIESNFSHCEAAKHELDDFVHSNRLESQLLVILARTYLIVQNRPAAAGCLQSCLKVASFRPKAKN
jgi:hypothetical protein